MLLGTILLYTANLTDESKVQAKDKFAAKNLTIALPEQKPQVLYQEMLTARNDVSKLSSNDLLRYHFASIGTPNGTIGVSGVKLTIGDWKQKEKANFGQVIQVAIF